MVYKTGPLDPVSGEPAILDFEAGAEKVTNHMLLFSITLYHPSNFRRTSTRIWEQGAKKAGETAAVGIVAIPSQPPGPLVSIKQADVDMGRPMVVVIDRWAIECFSSIPGTSI